MQWPVESAKKPFIECRQKSVRISEQQQQEREKKRIGRQKARNENDELIQCGSSKC